MKQHSDKILFWDMKSAYGIAFSILMFGVIAFGIGSYRYQYGTPEHVVESHTGTHHIPERSAGNPQSISLIITGSGIAGVGLLGLLGVGITHVIILKRRYHIEN